MRARDAQNSSSVDERPLVVLGSEGFIGGHLMALGASRAVRVGIERARGEDSIRLRTALCGIPDKPIVIQAAGSVSKLSVSSTRAYLKSTADLFRAVSAEQSGATVVTVGSIIEKLDAQTPYAEVKRQQRTLAEEAADQFGIHWIHVLLHNPVGPRQAHTQAAGAMARRLLHGIQQGSSLLRVKGARSVRDWIDVRDACRMLISIAENSDRTEGPMDLEVCTGTGHTVMALATAIVNASGAEVKIVEDDVTESNRSSSLIPNASQNASACADASSSSNADAVIGDTTRLERVIGAAARPRYTLERSMRDLWDALLLSERLRG